jgi:glutaminase
VVGEREAGYVLGVMATCGMYDYSGEWLLRAGLPAKSGVSGALIAAGPAQFGIGLFSPPVDRRGNSVRAVQAMQRISQTFDLDLVRHVGLSAPVAHWRAHGPVAVLEVQGELDFAAAEVVLGELLRLPGSGTRILLLDLDRVSRIWPVAADVLTAAAADLAEHGVRATAAGPTADQVGGVQRFAGPAEALAWCEDTLRAEGGEP